MSARKRKLFRATIQSTMSNENILVAAHEIVECPASTYHKFTYPNGVVQYKNDFGVSAVTLIPVEMTEAELEKAGY